MDSERFETPKTDCMLKFYKTNNSISLDSRFVDLKNTGERVTLILGGYVLHCQLHMQADYPPVTVLALYLTCQLVFYSLNGLALMFRILKCSDMHKSSKQVIPLPSVALLLSHMHQKHLKC